MLRAGRHCVHALTVKLLPRSDQSFWAKRILTPDIVFMSVSLRAVANWPKDVVWPQRSLANRADQGHTPPSQY